MFLQENPWWRWEKAALDFNKIRKNLLELSNIKNLDELMVAWCPQVTATGGLHNISFIRRKPEPLGTEFKTSVCPITRVLGFVEIQKGKVTMKDKKYYQELGAGASCVKRIALATDENDPAFPPILVADAWFGSVKSVVEVARSEGREEDEKNHVNVSLLSKDRIQCIPRISLAMPSRKHLVVLILL